MTLCAIRISRLSNHNTQHQRSEQHVKTCKKLWKIVVFGRCQIMFLNNIVLPHFLILASRPSGFFHRDKGTLLLQPSKNNGRRSGSHRVVTALNRNLQQKGTKDGQLLFRMNSKRVQVRLLLLQMWFLTTNCQR